MSEYHIKFYIDQVTRKVPVQDYIFALDCKTRAKVEKYFELLKESDGYLSEPYSRHIKGKIRELRVDFSGGRHRFFYFAFIDKQVVMLHAFRKFTPKTPVKEINIAEQRLIDIQNNLQTYEQ